MKTKYFLIFILLPTIASAADDTTCYKNEIGLSGMNVRTNLVPLCYSPDVTIFGANIKSSRCYYGKPRYSSMLPEIYYTRLIKKKWKGRVNFGTADFTEPLPTMNQNFYQRIEKRYTASLGVQCEFYQSKKWTTYTGVGAKGFLLNEIFYFRNLDEIFNHLLIANSLYGHNY